MLRGIIWPSTGIVFKYRRMQQELSTPLTAQPRRNHGQQRHKARIGLVGSFV